MEEINYKFCNPNANVNIQIKKFKLIDFIELFTYNTII